MNIPEKYKFIIQLGKALHTYGVPSYKTEGYLSEIAEQKGIKGSFMDTPTWINYAFYEEDQHSFNYEECVPPGGLNLGALSQIVEITNNVLHKNLSFEKAKTEIEMIKTAPLEYGNFLEMLGFMVSAGAFSIILNTGWVSAFVATGLGAVAYGISLLARKSNYINSILESLVALVSTILAGLLSLVFPQINISLTILASIIVFIPGLAITTALEEITSKNLVSGTAKLFDALVSLFKQFFGVALGLSILSLFVELKQEEVINKVPIWFDYLAIILLAASLAPVLRIRKKDILYCVIAGFFSFFATMIFDFTGIIISIFIGTIVAVSFSKLFSKITKSPELVFLVPGIIMLVPGSKAFISLSTVFLNSESPHPQMGEQVFYIFMGIIGGLIFSGSFADKKR